MGIGKTCKEMGTPRKPLAEYFQKLEEEDGYISLRSQLKRYTAQQKGQKETPNDAEDNREDVDYFEEMDGLNNPTNSPLNSAYKRVMKPPPATTGNSQDKEKQPQEESQTVNKDQTPTEKNPTTEQTPTPETKSPEEIPKGNENVDNPTAKQSQAQQCLNLIYKPRIKKMLTQNKLNLLENHMLNSSIWKIILSWRKMEVTSLLLLTFSQQ